MKIDQLLPCPWCGGPGEPYPDGDMEGHAIMCMSTNCHGGFGTHASDEAAAEAWNTRASPWLPIDQAPLSDPIVVWQGKDWVLAECSEYRGWCDMGGMELDPQPTHYLPIHPLGEVSP